MQINKVSQTKFGHDPVAKSNGFRKMIAGIDKNNGNSLINPAEHMKENQTMSLKRGSGEVPLTFFPVLVDSIFEFLEVHAFSRDKDKL